MLVTFVLTLITTLCFFAMPKNAYANVNIFANVKNNSFELTSEQFGKDLPTDWVINGNNFDSDKVGVISTNAYDQLKYLQVENDSYVIESQDYIQIESDYDYMFGVKMLFSNADDSITLKTYSYNDDNELIGSHQSQTVQSKQELIDTWQETFFVLKFNAKPIIKAATINCKEFPERKGSIIFDGLVASGSMVLK